MYKVTQPGVIVSLLNDSVKPIFLLGAGASKQSGIKLVTEIVEEVAKWAYCKSYGISIDDPRLTMSDWKKWVIKFPWYTEDYGLLYPKIVEELLNPRQSRKDFFLKIINPDVPSSRGYEVICELMALGLVDTVLTTNFDNCLYHAKVQIRRPPVLQSIRTPDDLKQFSYTPKYPQLIYLHGSVEHYTDQNLLNEVQHLNPLFISSLNPLLKDRPLIIVGYRGAESSIMNDLFLQNLQFTNNFHQGIYWCLLKREAEKLLSNDSAFPVHFRELANKTKGNFQIVAIDGFDELMEREVWRKLKADEIDLKHTVAISFTQTGISPTYDTQIVPKSSIGPLEIAVIRERLRHYSERLGIKVYEDEEWIYQQMARLRIAEFTNGNKYELTASGILLFSSQTQEFIPNAYTLLRFVGDPTWLVKITSFLSETQEETEDMSNNFIERKVSGNLWNQLNEITDSLTLVNRPFRLKGEFSENVYPYPTLALKEVIVNSLVHRDYSTPAPILIEVHQTHIIFNSPGGLVEEVKRQLSSDSIEDEIRKGRKGIKGYRNPVLADLFYGSGAMDKEGSGLSDVIQQVKNNSSTVTFGQRNDGADFEVKIYRRFEEVDRETQTAAPLIVNQSTKFACNLLEILKLPSRIYHASTTARYPIEVSKILVGIWNPPFYLSRERMWSFYDLSEWQNPLRKCVDLGTVESMSIDEFIDLTSDTKELVRMLNDCLAEHLFSIGLRVDTKKKRAYFTATREGKAKEITYQGRLKKATRTVAKPRTNLATQRVYYWEHKSIWYSFENMGGTWYLLINPAYVFTSDGVKNLLKSEKVNVLSTKRASRDYNMSVHNDLTFWSTYISQGSESAFLLRLNNKEINEGNVLGPIPPEIIISSKIPTITVNDISVSDEFIEPTEVVDIAEIERELEELAKEQENFK